MIVAIPSRGRAGNVRTLEYLPQGQQVMLVVPKKEMTTYNTRHGEIPNLSVAEVSCRHIGQKRQWILDLYRGHGGQKIVMIDDDLRFRVRDNGNTFRRAEPEDVARMLRLLEELLDRTPHAGIADEFMCHYNQPGTKGGRYNQVLAYNLAHPVFQGGNAPRFRLAINEEHDMHLQLASRGHRPLVLTDYTKGSKYNAAGGCSTWRTAEFEREQFEEFRDLWPDLVTIEPNKKSLSGLSTRVKWRAACPR